MHSQVSPARVLRPGFRLGCTSLLGLASLALSAEGALPQGPIVLEVDDYGAAPNNSAHDDRPAIQAALEDARGYLALGASVEVHLSNAEYHLNTASPQDPEHALLMQNFEYSGDLTLSSDGGASIVLAVQGVDLIRLESCNRVALDSLTLDVWPLPYFDAQVAATEQVYVPPQPNPAATLYTGVTVDVIRGLSGVQGLGILGDAEAVGADLWGWYLDPAVPGRPRSGLPSAFTPSGTPSIPLGIDLVPNTDQYKFIFKGAVNTASLYPLGSRLTFHYRSGHNIAFQDCHDIQFRDITTYGSAHFFIWGVNSSSVLLQSCRAEIKSGRWRSTNGDGVHCTNIDDIVISHCSFEGISDDGIHLKQCSPFAIEYCTFKNKRRHGILLDGDQPPFDSSNGSIVGNSSSYNGGTFFIHTGGSYPNTALSGNTATSNNLAKHKGTSRLTKFKLGVDNNLAIASADLMVQDGSSLELRPTYSPETLWDRLEFIEGPGPKTNLLQNRSARDAQDWLYMTRTNSLVGGSSLDAPGVVHYVEIQGPNLVPDENGEQQKWKLVPSGTSGTFRIQAKDSPWYLTLTDTGNPAQSGDVVHLSRLLSGADAARQEWVPEEVDE